MGIPDRWRRFVSASKINVQRRDCQSLPQTGAEKGPVEQSVLGRGARALRAGIEANLTIAGLHRNRRTGIR